MRIRARFAFLLPAILLLAACDEEDVQYTMPAEEQVPPVPEHPSSIDGPRAPMDNPHGGMAAPSDAAAELAPKPHDFTVEEPKSEFGEVELVGLRFPLPTSFERLESTSSMRAGQWKIGEDVELVAFYFGKGQGGSAQDNITRWARQFEAREGSAVKGVHQGQHHGLTVTRIVLEGTWNQPAMPGAPAGASGPKDDWSMDGIIVEGGPEGALFLRLTGPRETVRQQSPAMEYLAARVVPASLEE